MSDFIHSMEGTIQNGKIRLTVKEAALLALLMQNKGQVITKNVLGKIWGYDTEAGMANVDLYIYYLRQKAHRKNYPDDSRHWLYL